MTFRPWIVLAGMVAVLAVTFSPGVDAIKTLLAIVGLVLLTAVGARENEK